MTFFGKAAIVFFAIAALFVALLLVSPQLLWNTMLTVDRIHYELTSDDTPAAERLKKAETRLTKNPDDADAWYEKGLALDSKATREDALAAAEHAIALDPAQKKYHWLKCYIVERLYEPADALAILEEHSGKFPKQSEPWFSMYFVYSKTGDYEKSLACQKKLIELEPDRPDNYGFVASSMLYGGDIEESLPYIDKALELMGDVPFYKLHDRALCAMFTSQKAHTLSLLGRHEEALNLVSQARRLNPNDGFYITPLVYSSVALGNTEKAVYEVEHQPFKSTDENRLLAYSLLHRDGVEDRTAAKQILESTLNEANEKDSVLIYALLGERDRALELMEKVCADNPHMKQGYRLAPELEGLRDDPRFVAITGS